MDKAIQNITVDLERTTGEVRHLFGSLTAEQINWKPSTESWSVGQCLEHLIKINSAYFPDFEAIINGGRKNSFWENYSPLSGFFGNLLFKSLSPKSERKLKAPKAAQPSPSDISPAIVEDFVKHQAELADKIRQTERLDTGKIIVTSPFIKIITYSLFDAYRIIATHEKRHVLQARRVIETEVFPK